MGRNYNSIANNGAGIKSIQRGTFTHTSSTSGTVTFTETISAVDLEKSFISTLRSKHFSYGYNVWENTTFASVECEAPDVYLSDSTTITASAQNSSFNQVGRRRPIVAYEVIEYY
jgi:hypothetical protein